MRNMVLSVVRCGAVLALLIPAPLFAQSASGPAHADNEQDDPGAILARARRVADEIQSLSCVVHFDRFGGEDVSPRWGYEKCLIRRTDSDNGVVLALTGSRFDSTARAVTRTSVHALEDDVYRLDQNGVWWYAKGEGPASQMLAESRANGNPVVYMFLFGSNLFPVPDDPSLRRVGESLVDGQVCDVLSVEKGNDPAILSVHRYHIAQHDGVLRRMETWPPLRNADDLASVTTVTLSDVQVNTPITLEMLLPPIPPEADMRRYEANTPAPRSHTTARVGAGDRFPDIEITTLEGAVVSMADLSGPLVIDIWGIWCAPCVAGLPEIQDASDALAEDDVQVIGFDFGDSASQISEFVNRHGYTFDQYRLDEVGRQALDIFSYPTIFVIDAGGRVVYRGHPKAGELLETVRRSLATGSEETDH